MSVAAVVLLVLDARPFFPRPRGGRFPLPVPSPGSVYSHDALKPLTCLPSFVVALMTMIGAT